MNNHVSMSAGVFSAFGGAVVTAVQLWFAPWDVSLLEGVLFGALLYTFRAKDAHLCLRATYFIMAVMLGYAAGAWGVVALSSVPHMLVGVACGAFILLLLLALFDFVSQDASNIAASLVREVVGRVTSFIRGGTS